MRAWRLKDHGSIDKLELTEFPPPAAAPGEAVVRLRAAALNPRDLMVILGPSPYGPRPDLIPLSDGAGEVLAVGEGVHRVKAGDRVVIAFRPGWTHGPLDPASIAGDLGGGADGVLAEARALPAEALVVLPDSVSFEAAATLPCAGVTAWRALDVPDLKPGSTVLVQGTGGVSLFALQLAKAAGCRVLATTSSADKAAFLISLGADAVVDRILHPDWQIEVLALTGGRGADLIVEVGGAGTLARSFAAAAHGGTIALVGLLSDPMAQVSPLPVMTRMLTLRGVSVGSREDLEALVTDIAAGRHDPVIDRVFEFENAKEALRRLQRRRHMGKVLIRL